MTDRSEEYAAEIRDFLLGRLSRNRSSGSAERYASHELKGRALDWWMFEGGRFGGLDAPLAERWPAIFRAVRQLLATPNPVWRTSMHADGEVDWVATASLHARGEPTYVTRASQVGLSGDERDTLLAWLGWMRVRWDDYCSSLGVPTGAPADLGWPIDNTRLPATSPTDRTLLGWARVARRSRWPLLRNVIAEVLRCWLEPTTIDRLPLPAAHETLFELVCVVRVLCVLCAPEAKIRWLGRREGDNCIRFEGGSCEYQKTLDREDVLATTEYDHGLRAAAVRHRLRVSTDIDAFVRFDRPRQGFCGVLMEAKSGGQPYESAVSQLKSYRAALRASGVGPLVVCGICEMEQDVEGIVDELRAAPVSEPQQDLWVFSSGDRIPAMLSAILPPA